MKVRCRGYDRLSSNFSRNKCEHAIRHGPKNQKIKKPICYDSFNNLSLRPTENCEINATTKHSIKRHLKNCKKVSKNIKRNANNKVCKYCHKTFLKKSGRDRHVKRFNESSNNITCEDISNLIVNDGEIDKEFPTMVLIGSNNVEFNVNEVSPL